MRKSSIRAITAPAVGPSRAEGPDGAVALPPLAPLRSRAVGWRVLSSRLRLARGPLAGRLALASLGVATLAIVVFAAAGQTALAPRSYLSFPTWESGPLHGLFGHLVSNPTAVGIGLSGVLIAMLVAYGVALSAVRSLSMRTIAIFVLLLHAILLLSPPLQLTDLFNYLGYARLGGLHHLNPYTHVIGQELHDPIFRFTSWHNLRSPYGPLFTAASFPLAWLPIPVAYWILKVITVLASLGFVAVIWKCARQLGRDPRFAVLFLAANPIFLIYGVGGFHNDFFMLLPATGAVALLLARRDRTAGAVLMLAVGVKFTALLLLPFLLLGARPAQRRLRVLEGAVLGAIPLVALSVAVFGFSLPNLSDQSTLLTEFSIPNVVGLAIGAGGGVPALLRVADLLMIVTIVLLVRSRRPDWLSSAGWATLALIASLPWLVPWYGIWLLPLAVLGTSVRLRRVAVALSVYLVVAFVPATGMFLYAHNLNPMGSSVGQASKELQKKLAQ